MYIPDKIRAFGVDYEVVFHDGTKTGNYNLGTLEHSRTRIFLNINQSYQQQDSSFFHEIIELINASLELKLEHQTIAALECGLYSILSDNRLLYDADEETEQNYKREKNGRQSSGRRRCALSGD